MKKPLWERYNEAKRAGLVSTKTIRKLALRERKVQLLQAEGTPESRKRLKEMQQHSYGRDKHNLNGFWNGSTKAGRKTKPMHYVHSKRHITTLAKIRGE